MGAAGKMELPALEGGVKKVRKHVYQHGIAGKRFGIWNTEKKQFQFDICEDTPMLAVARLFQMIGDDARKWKFEPRALPDRARRSKPW